MRSILIFLFLILLLIPVLSAEEVILAEIFNPSSIKVDDQKIYIVQDVNTFIYSVKDFKLINKFGKAGEGPREFIKSPAPWIPSITLYLNAENCSQDNIKYPWLEFSIIPGMPIQEKTGNQYDTD